MARSATATPGDGGHGPGCSARVPHVGVAERPLNFWCIRGGRRDEGIAAGGSARSSRQHTSSHAQGGASINPRRRLHRRAHTILANRNPPRGACRRAGHRAGLARFAKRLAALSNLPIAARRFDPKGALRARRALETCGAVFARVVSLGAHLAVRRTVAGRDGAVLAPRAARRVDGAEPSAPRAVPAGHFVQVQIPTSWPGVLCLFAASALPQY